MAILDRLIGGISASAALRRALTVSDKGEVKRAFPLFARAARAGIAEAEFRLARCYLEGTGVPHSRPQGVRWLERAANQGFVEAQVLLATLSLHGIVASSGDGGPASLFDTPGGGTGSNEPDFATAEKWARRAADAGSADGQALLGYILTSGPEEMRKPDEAVGWYKKSAEAGCPQGHLGYALALAQNARAPETQAAITEHLRQAADKGLATALYLYGTLTERGVGLPADRTAASQLYRKAAEKGHRSGQAKWGLALMEGLGVEANPTEGKSWLRRAALAGDAEAAALVGDLYARGGRLAAELRRSGDVVPPRGGGQPSCGGASTRDALSYRRRRRAGPAGGRQLVPGLGSGRRPRRAGGTGEPVAGRRRGQSGRQRPDQGMVRRSRRLGRSRGCFQFRRVPGGRGRRRAGRPQGGGVAAQGR